MKKEIQKILKEAIKALQKDKVWPDFKLGEIQVDYPSDEKFGDYGTFTEKGIDALEKEVQFRLNIKSFISQSLTHALTAQREEMVVGITKISIFNL